MGNKNYSKHFKFNNNRNKNANNEEDKAVITEAINTVTPINEEVESEFVTGIVTGCKKLNVRKESNKNSDILCVIDESSEVMVFHNSTEDFYKVTTASGVEGYCMKKYITIK